MGGQKRETNYVRLGGVYEKAKAAGISDSQRYKQAGNSMTVAVVEMIFRQIDKALSKQANNTSLFGSAA